MATNLGVIQATVRLSTEKLDRIIDLEDEIARHQRELAPLKGMLEKAKDEALTPEDEH